MPSVRYSDTPSPGLWFLPAIVANVLPLAGVVWFSWEPETLVTIYAPELLTMLSLAGVKALFAGKPPASDREKGIFDVSESDLTEKRGNVVLHDWLPPIYPRNVPFAAAVISGGVWLGFFIFAPLADVVPVLDILSRREVLLSVAMLAVGQVAETGLAYFRSGRYAAVSPYAVVEIPARQGLFLSVFLFVVTVGGATPVLVVFVAVKVLFEWSGVRVERGNGGRLTGWLSGPDSDTATASLEIPEGEPSAIVDVDRRSVVASALWRVVSETGPFYLVLAIFVWLGVPAFLGGTEASLSLWIASGLFGLALLGLMLAGDIIEVVFADAWMTYYRIGDQLVAHDRLTNAPQWVAAIGELRDATVIETRLADRYIGTRTLIMTTGWGDDETSRTLGPVNDPQTFVETFDLPLHSTDLSPLDRRFVAAAVGSAALIAGGGIVVVLSSSVSWVILPMAVPLLGVVPIGFWKLAHT